MKEIGDNDCWKHRLINYVIAKSLASHEVPPLHLTFTLPSPEQPEIFHRNWEKFQDSSYVTGFTHLPHPSHDKNFVDEFFFLLTSDIMLKWMYT